jgi:DNA end-binding protein Ku
MSTTIWKGHLTFGLVSMPVRLVRAARAEHVKLRQLYRAPRATSSHEELKSSLISQRGAQRPPEARVDAPEQFAAKVEPSSKPHADEHVAPVRRAFQSLDESAPIAPENLVKGYEFDKGQYVVLEEQELRTLVAQTSTDIQIVEFVRFQEIDPVYLETSYYIVPDQNAEKAYALLLEAMRQTGFAAIGQLTMHRRDHVLIVRPGNTGLVGHTMFYPDEVRSTEEFRTDTALVAQKELDLAKTLIAALSQPFDPARFKNAFRERLQSLIESRIEGQETARVEPRAATKVIDIMDALKRSLEQTKSHLHEPGRVDTDRKPPTAEPSRRKGPAGSSKRKH